MVRSKQPSKEAVREWLRNEIRQRRPPPDQGQIRRELGWDLIDVSRNVRQRAKY